MEAFDSLEQLCEEIRRDKDHPSCPSAQRYPVRLIFLPHLLMLKDLVNQVEALQIEKYELCEALPHDDGWFTDDRLIRTIRELPPQKDYLVVPFSEVVRFYPDDKLRSILNCLTTEIENTGHARKERRIYLPLVGISERVESVLRDVHRYRQHEWAPIWKVKGETQKINIYFFQTRLTSHSPYTNVISNTKEWLNFWKRQDIDTVVCFSKTLNYHHKHSHPDHAFELKKIETFPELIAVMKDIQIPIPYDPKEDKYWEMLWELVHDQSFNTFEELVTATFNRQEILQAEVVNLYLDQANAFHKWLLQQYVLSQPQWAKTYIFHLFKGVTTFEDRELITALWLNIFDVWPCTSAWIQERQGYFRTASRLSENITLDIEQKLQQKLETLPDLSKHVELLTGITMYERQFAIRLFQEQARSPHQTENLLRGIYPHLADYLSEIRLDDLKLEQAWIEEYFREYRRSKATHAKSERLVQLLAEHNHDKDTFYRWYYSFPSAHSAELLQAFQVKKFLWIDGLGAEWLPLLTKLVESAGLVVEKKCLARANLPTTTVCNRFESDIYVPDLDQFIHHKGRYDYPDDLIHEIEILAAIVEKYLLTDERIMIVSDHGLTAFAIAAFENQKKYAFDKADHEGRCLWTDQELLDDEDFIVHPVEYGEQKNRKSLMALKHSSLYHVPRREVHGGATPEEVLVPVLILSKGVLQNGQTYLVTPLEQQVSPRNPVVGFTIQPQPDIRPKLRHDNRTLELEYHEQDGMWTTRLEDLKPRQYEMVLEIGKWQCQATITIKAGMQIKELL